MSGVPSVLIMGASGGIGGAIYGQLAKDGCRVFGTYLTGLTRAKELEAASPGTRMISCDIGSSDQIDAVFDDVVGAAGGIDVLIFCATPPLRLRPLETDSAADMRKDMDILYWGAVHAMRKAIPAMKVRRSGLILGLLSSVTEDAPPRMASYTAAKSALLGYLRCASAELKAYGVRALGISPYFVETDLIKVFPPKLLELERQKQPGGQFLTAADIASLVAGVVKKSFAGSLTGPDHWMVRNKTDIERYVS